MNQPRHEGVEAHAHDGVDARDASNDPVIFDAILTPHRSLSPRGFVTLMSVVCAISFVAGFGFFLMGAWPVVGFIGLDILLIYAAFKINFRAGRMFETVRLTRGNLLVERISARGDKQRWQFQPAWLQVLMDDPPRHESQITLRSHGRSLTIGSFLTAEERLDFAKALAKALDRAKAPNSA
jgi:uncharacterized membrane protein